MYWARAISVDDLIDESHIGGGRHVFAHGISRLNLDVNDVEAFVRPEDAALMFGHRAMEDGGTFEDSFVVWMATMRRRGQSNDAIVECLKRVFAQMADEPSLVELLRGLIEQARGSGYGKVWLARALFDEALLAPALVPIANELGHPVEHVPSSGMTALVIDSNAAVGKKSWWRFW